jgi:predicted permease
MHILLQDVRYAVRQIARAPGFAVVAVLTLALGIGANTALFTLGNSILLRPRPGVRDAERLVWISPLSIYNGRAMSMSYPDYRVYRDELREVFRDVAAIDDVWLSIGGDGAEPARVRGQFVSANFFETVGAPIVLGRGFTADDERARGASPVAVMSHHFWERRYGGDPSVIGRQIVVNGKRLTVVGVAARAFNGPDHQDEWRALWIPLAMMPTLRPNAGADWLTSTGVSYLRVLGRLHPDVSPARADAAVATIAARLWRADSTNREAKTGRAFAARSGLSPGKDPELVPVTVLAGAVTGVVLLIACANVSNLLLGRAVSRRREMAVRVAIGASRGRVVWQLLTESMVLGVVASGLALLVAVWGAHVIVTTMIPLPLELAPDARVFGFSIAVAVVATALFGLVPALHATRSDVASVLKDGAPGSSRRRARLQSGFVIAQVSLSLVLLVTAGLFLRSLQKAQAIDVGFDASQQVLALSFDLRMQGYDEDRDRAFVHALGGRVRGLPSVESVALASQVPMSSRLVFGDIVLEEQRAESVTRGRENRQRALFNSVTPGFFRTVGLPLVRGRDFDDRDVAGAPGVAIVSEQLAKQLWPRADPLGKRLSMNGEDGPYLSVVGVSREALVAGIRERTSSTVYVPRAQNREMTDLTLLVRAKGDASQLAGAVRSEARSLDPNLPVYGVQTLAQYRRAHMAESRSGSTLLGIFGGLALILASIGVYGVLAFAVSQRTREIGVRMALGARQGEVVRLFLREGVRRTLLGIGIGLALSFAVARLLASVFLGVTPGDAVAFGSVAALLLVVATVACWLPARRAARVNPIEALRYE